MNADNSLDALRREIDRIDNGIHDLLMRRTELAEKIRREKAGGGINLRPGREAEILRRLVGRHSGRFPKTSLVRVWREIFAAAVGLQGPFSLAVYRPEGVEGYASLARDQYGSFTPMTSHATEQRVIEQVTRGRASVGILPLPEPDDAEPWWPRLVATGKDMPRIVARLPFAAPPGSRSRPEALVISRLGQEKTGRDRTFLALDSESKIDLVRLRRAFAAARLPATLIGPWADDERTGPWLHLAEVDGFVAPDDGRLKALVGAAGPTAQRAVVLGSYAVPFDSEELAPTAAPGRSGRRLASRPEAASRKAG